MPTSLLALFKQHRQGGMEYERMGGEPSGSGLEEVLPRPFSRLHSLHSFLKGTAQLQIFLGLASFALGALADYTAASGGGLRVPAIPEVCALYFIVSGLVGVCGSASLRRGLVTAFVVMSLHSAIFFVPFLLASSAASLLLSQRNCYLQTPPDSLNIFCGQSAIDFMEGNPDALKALMADDRLEWGLIGMGTLQFFLAILSVVVGLMALCEKFGVVDIDTIHHINKLTAYGRVDGPEAVVATISG